MEFINNAICPGATNMLPIEASSDHYEKSTVPAHRKAFADYAAHYNAADPKVKLAIDHTYRVAALCGDVLPTAFPPPAGCRIWPGCAAFCTMWAGFRTAAPLRHVHRPKSIDHALMSVTVLFEEGRNLRDYIAGTDEDALLRTHGHPPAQRLPPAGGMDDHTRMFCQICGTRRLRTSLRVNVETPMEQIYNVSTEALRQSPVSPAVLDAFYEHHCVLRTLNHYLPITPWGMLRCIF